MRAAPSNEAASAYAGFASQNASPHVHASQVVSWRLSRKLATAPERMMDAGQANATQNHARVCDPPTAAGQGLTARPAKAVSIDSQPVGITPHGTTTPGPAPDRGIIDGAKKSIAVINTTLTTLRGFICRPNSQGHPQSTLTLFTERPLWHFCHSGNDSGGHLR
jgi:hypothetical protein